jgi:hypothetical protein
MRSRLTALSVEDVDALGARGWGRCWRHERGGASFGLERHRQAARRIAAIAVRLSDRVPS